MTFVHKLDPGILEMLLLDPGGGKELEGGGGECLSHPALVRLPTSKWCLYCDDRCKAPASQHATLMNEFENLVLLFLGLV